MDTVILSVPTLTPPALTPPNNLHHEETSQASEDRIRAEEPWDERNEALVGGWLNDTKTKVQLHSKSGYIFKHKNVKWGLPSVIIPVIMSPISLMVTGNNSDTIKAVMFLLVGLFTGVHSFFKYGEQSQKHFNHASRYEELVNNIAVEMHKHRAFRTQADVFIAKTQSHLHTLNDSAPIIPTGVLGETKPGVIVRFFAWIKSCCI